MKLKAYPKYKPSGVEWLGDVPEGWDVSPLKWLVSQTNEKTQAKDTNGEYIGMENIESWSGKWKEGSSNGETEGLANSFDVNDVLFGKLRPYLAKAWLADRKGVCSSELLVLRPKRIKANFLRHQVLNGDFVTLVDSSTYGSKMPRASWEFIGAIKLPLPPPIEQSSIATFLDRETAKIDTLIAKQEKLIELLKEKRQAVISHAVTKGIDPTVPMKPSGVEWLDDVPEHWDVKQLRHFAEIRRGKFTHRPRNDPAFYDGPYAFIQTGDITGVTRYITEYKQTLNHKGAAVSQEFPSGTLVMTIAANIADVAILNFSAYFPDSIVGLIPNSSVDLMYLYYLAGSMKQPLTRVATVSTQLNLNTDQIAGVHAACPPIAEQHAIVTYLDKTTQKIDALIAKAQQAISLQKEHRTALISAAVTGKIDVRDAASELQEAA